MTIKYHYEMLQRSEEWYAARCGLLTASEMKHIITPGKLQAAANDKSKSHLFELLAQRITGYTEPAYVSFDMERGELEENYAKHEYNKHYAETKDCGFVTNDEWGFTLGFSPDALVGDDGFIECKSRLAKYQLQTILANEMPDDFKIQVQTGLLVTARAWCDFISYSGGVHMITLRVFTDIVVQTAIIEAAKTFHEKLDAAMEKYKERLADKDFRLLPTERTIMEQEIVV